MFRTRGRSTSIGLKSTLSQVVSLLLLLSVLPATLHAQFTFTTNSNTLTITGYSGSGGAVTIPSTTNGLTIASIGTNEPTRSREVPL